MANDPAFLFYPGDYLRDTQCLSETVQVAYDRIMCEHMRNICISQQQLKFFTKRLNVDEIEELMMVLTEVNGGFQITWVAESIVKRKAYSDSRRNNRSSKPKDISSTYDEHMENEIENVNEDINTDVIKKIENSENIFIQTILETDDEFLETVCDYFSQTTEVLKMRVHSFMSAQIKNGKFDEFKKQTLAYISYKNQSEEVKHRWQNYVTEWDKEDWTNKKAVNKRRETVTTTADDNR